RPRGRRKSECGKNPESTNAMHTPRPAYRVRGHIRSTSDGICGRMLTTPLAALAGWAPRRERSDRRGHSAHVTRARLLLLLFDVRRVAHHAATERRVAD